MKIDFRKLKEVEKKYQEQDLPRYTLQLMIGNVINFRDTSYKLAPNNIQLSINTLKELGILYEEETEKPVQLLKS